ncbi:MAG: rod shape-determining protein MreC [Anaerolineaceae bacterium]|nr:rod shape-determining protein MreC [Anaerolineaceae bacterium]
MKINLSNIWLTGVISVIAVGLILLALGGYLSPVINAVSQPFLGIQEWISSRYVAIYQLVNTPQDVNELRTSNIELENEVSRLQAQIIELEQQLGEKEVLEALLNYEQDNPESSYMAASVIGRDPSPFLHYIIIDRGSDDGVFSGMPVITQSGLVGRIDAVTSQAARVQLITDPKSIVNVKLETQKINAQINGSITGEITLEMVPQDINLVSGDLILTSGLGGAYPSNLPIGQVVSVRKLENDLFQSATIQPVVDFNALQALLVITNFKPVDITPLIPVEN